MTPEMQKELLSRLDVLAAKLGVTSESLWKVYMQQAHIVGMQDIIASISCILVSLGLGIFTWRLVRWIKGERYEEGWYFLVIPTGIVSLVLVPVAISYGMDAYSLLTNPSFWAFSQLVSAMK